LLTRLLTAPLSSVGYRSGEDVGSLGELVVDDVGVYAQRDGGVGMAEPDGDDMDRDACEQTGNERFTSRVEYFSLKHREMPSFVLVDELLLLPRLHQAVARCNPNGCHAVAPDATWHSHSPLTWGFVLTASPGCRQVQCCIPYCVVITLLGE
jgi:hypothetical protein